MKKLLILLMLVSAVAHNAYADDELVYNKQWQVSGGEVAISMWCDMAEAGWCRLVTTPSGKTPEQQTIEVTLAQEAQVMDEAIQEMLRRGKKLSELHGINVDRVLEPEVVEKMAVASYNSVHWQQCKKTWKPNPHVVMQELLDETQPYEAFNPLFNKYGWQIKKVYVGEKVLQKAKYSSLKIPYPPGKKKDMYVLTGSAALIAIEPCKNGVCTEPAKQ